MESLDDAQTVIEHPINPEDAAVDEFLKEVDEKHYKSDAGIAEAWEMIKDRDHARDTQLVRHSAFFMC